MKLKDIRHQKMNQNETVNNDTNTKIENIDIPFLNSNIEQNNPLEYFFKNDKEYFTINKKIENNNELYTFLNSILTIGDEIFTLNTFQNKKNIMKKLIKKMDDDLIKNDLYFLYNYDKNRKYNKEKILTTLKELYKFNVDEKTISLFKQYVADYLGINIFIIGLINNKIDFDNKEFYLTHKYSLTYNKYAQTFILIAENNIYYPLIKNSNETFNGFKYDNLKLYLTNFLNFYNIVEEPSIEKNIPNVDTNTDKINIDKINIETDKINIETDKINITDTTNTAEKKNNNYNEKDLKKLKLDELKKLAEENNINIKKNSDKTNKMIGKTKTELIENLINN
jgi:hypothetical protein